MSNYRVQPKNSSQFVAGQAVAALFVLAIVGAVVWYFFLGGLDQQVATTMGGIEQQVAVDAVKQYEIARRQGERMQICVQAGFVSAAYLQAKDERSYQRWKGVESQDCAAAGLRR